MTTFQTVARVSEIPPGQCRAFSMGKYQVAVFNVDGEFRAIDDMCPHQGASLSAGHCDGGIVTCPLHAWRFDTADGTWLDSPRLKIDVFPVRIVGDEIQIGPPEKDEQAAGGPLGGIIHPAADPSQDEDSSHE